MGQSIVRSKGLVALTSALRLAAILDRALAPAGTAASAHERKNSQLIRGFQTGAGIA